MASKNIERSIIQATNVMAELAEKLPENWEIELHFNRDECYLHLVDPTGHVVQVHGAERNYSEFSAALDTAIEAGKDSTCP